MSFFNALVDGIQSRKAACLLLGGLLLSACETPRTFEDAGVYDGDNYTIEVARVPDGLFRIYYISINGDQILKIDRELLATPPDRCQKVSFYVTQCNFNTQYEGKAVKVIQEVDARPFQQNAYYSVYFDGVLIRRVTTPLL